MKISQPIFGILVVLTKNELMKICNEPGTRLVSEKHFNFFFNPIFFFRPKNGTHEALEEYKKAEKIGEEQGDCWSFYPECPISIFNVIPDVYTTDDQVEVSFDGFDSGSKFDASNDTSEVTHLLCFISRFFGSCEGACRILEMFFNPKTKDIFWFRI